MIARLIAAIVANGIGLYIVGRYVSGAHIPPLGVGLILAAAVLTLINFFIRPIVKLIFSPLIFITLGLAVLVVNGLMLYILMRVMPAPYAVSFDGLIPLAYATIILTLVNLVVHLV